MTKIMTEKAKKLAIMVKFRKIIKLTVYNLIMKHILRKKLCCYSRIFKSNKYKDDYKPISNDKKNIFGCCIGLVLLTIIIIIMLCFFSSSSDKVQIQVIKP